MVRAPNEEPRRRVYGVSERLVMPGTRFEIIEGEVRYVNAAGPVHATYHSKLAALLEACVAEGYDVAADMLTRTSAFSDLAPDASVFREGIDPVTQDRALEELAFEILSSQEDSDAARKARSLTMRGVRRVFGIDVVEKRFLEWSRADDMWFGYAGSEALVDKALAAPLPIKDVLDAARADDAMARALLEKKNPVIFAAVAAGESRGEARGEAKGLARAVLQLLLARSITFSASDEARIRDTLDVELLETWIRKATACNSVDELFEAKPSKRKRRQDRR
ncbi:MAG: Uma2 family endonuclease [Deltaproteobacteria bacterium]|nr:Uma2 family endonuclease [Deltaproteobacteria bacterium]